MHTWNHFFSVHIARTVLWRRSVVNYTLEGATVTMSLKTQFVPSSYLVPDSESHTPIELYPGCTLFSSGTPARIGSNWGHRPPRRSAGNLGAQELPTHDATGLRRQLAYLRAQLPVAPISDA